MSSLQRNFSASAARDPVRIALVEPGRGELSYAQLDALSDRVRDRLVADGVGQGDRVGLFMAKSANSVAAILGILKSGAAYVPVDAGGPAERGAYILGHCGVKALFIDAEQQQRLLPALQQQGAAPRLYAVPELPLAGAGLTALLDALPPPPPVASLDTGPDALAYILYTSGSTGRPKGVMLSQGNAQCFIDWCAATFEPRTEDRFSSHAPFHFDLSIFDLHLCFRQGATLVLVGEDIGKDAPRLAALIAEQRISIWYSAPSILALLAQFGDLSRHDFSALRQVHFAGEVFAVKHLRALTELWPAPRYFNLYGPTETNVCTWHEVQLPVPAERSTPYPIGRVCPPLIARVCDPDGQELPLGEEGELCIAGPGVMQGYWDLPEQSAKAFWVDADGRRWYRTGDVVIESADWGYTYRGRRDRMVKRRGYRVELGEIEAALYKHAQVKEVAVLAAPDLEGNLLITAFLQAQGEKAPGLIEMKRFSAEQMPLYMIPDRFRWLPEGLPKTSTDKTDYQRLKELL